MPDDGWQLPVALKPGASGFAACCSPGRWLLLGWASPLVASTLMSVQPAHEVDIDDPVEILKVLPARLHDQFLREYYGAAASAARQIGGYRHLHDVLRLWRLTAMAQSEPGFADRLAAVREAVSSGNLDSSVPIEDVVPGWRERS